MDIFWTLVGVYLILINLATFVVYGLDKYYAIREKWRIPERTLLLLAGVGGMIGAGAGMFIFHHKIRKPRFTVGIPLITAIYILIFLFAVTGVKAEAASMSKEPVNLKGKASGTSAVLTWEKRKGATGYRIEMFDSANQKQKALNTKSTKYTFKELDMNKTYSFRIRAFKKSGGTTIFSVPKKVSVKIPKVKTKSTLKKFLQTGLKPMGSTMYVWGGGWNEADTGAGKEARTIGVSRRWSAFFKKQGKGYDYNRTRYQIHDGLDCSGYVGWCIYNIMNTKNGKSGYVMSAGRMASAFAKRGWGTYRSAGKVKDYRAGDIMSSSGHVYIVVGQCKDGSVVLMHSSPPGVQLSGTPAKSGRKNSQAVKLAARYMKTYFPQWYKKYPDNARGMDYLRSYGQMRWDLSGTKIMSDPEGLRNKTADQVLKEIFR